MEVRPTTLAFSCEAALVMLQCSPYVALLHLLQRCVRLRRAGELWSAQNSGQSSETRSRTAQVGQSLGLMTRPRRHARSSGERKSMAGTVGSIRGSPRWRRLRVGTRAVKKIGRNDLYTSDPKHPYWRHAKVIHSPATAPRNLLRYTSRWTRFSRLMSTPFFESTPHER